MTEVLKHQEVDTSLITRLYPDGAIVLGGMGVDISSKYLVGAVAGMGGVGTGSDVGGAERLARGLQDGDTDGHIRESLSTFPNKSMVDYVIDTFLNEGGVRPEGAHLRYRPVPKYRLHNRTIRGEGLGVPPAEMLTVLDAYEQVTTARRIAAGAASERGIKPGPIGLNGLGKVPIPMSAALYGLMLAGGDFTTRGAGVRPDVPEVIETLHAGNPVRYMIPVDNNRVHYQIRRRATEPGAVIEPYTDEYLLFDPAPYVGRASSLPEFWAIAGTIGGAQAYVDAGASAIVHEKRLAGGHNMPKEIDEPPIQDFIDNVTVPVIVAGGVLQEGGLRYWTERGAAGIQIGSLFAVSAESGMSPKDRGRAIMNAVRGALEITDDNDISPTGYPFQTANIPDTVTDPEGPEMRRNCTISVLEVPYRDLSSGSIRYRCLADDRGKALESFPEGDRSARRIEAARCLCRVLFAASGRPQANLDTGEQDLPLVTLGQTAPNLIRMIVKQQGLPITVEKVLAFAQ